MSSINQFKKSAFFSKEFVAGTTTGANNWNGYENNLLFERVGDKEFADVARATGCDAIEDSRGVAIADINADGRLDIVISNNHGPPRIYLNQVEHAGNWLRLKLIGGQRSNRDAVGAHVRVAIMRDGQEQVLHRWVEAGTGYAAQSDMSIHFGLGAADRIESITIRWPDGAKQDCGRAQLDELVNGSWQLEQGDGTFRPLPMGSPSQVNSRRKTRVHQPNLHATQLATDVVERTED